MNKLVGSPWIPGMGILFRSFCVLEHISQGWWGTQVNMVWEIYYANILKWLQQFAHGQTNSQVIKDLPVRYNRGTRTELLRHYFFSLCTERIVLIFYVIFLHTKYTFVKVFTPP